MTSRTKCLGMAGFGVSAIFACKLSPLAAFLMILILFAVVYIIALDAD